MFNTHKHTHTHTNKNTQRHPHTQDKNTHTPSVASLAQASKCPSCFKPRCPVAPEGDLMLHAVAITRLLTGASVGETEAGAGPRAPSGRYRIRTRPRAARTHVGLALGAVAWRVRVHGAWRDSRKTESLPPNFAAAAAVDQASPTCGSGSRGRGRQPRPRSLR